MLMPLAGIDELSTRLGFTPVGAELALAEAALADASTLVRAHGLPWPDKATAPAVVVSVVLAASERRVRRPEGYRSEMQGSYQYQLPASAPTGVELTSGEMRLIRAACGVTGVYSVPIEGLGGSL